MNLTCYKCDINAFSDLFTVYKCSRIELINFFSESATTAEKRSKAKLQPALEVVLNIYLGSHDLITAAFVGDVTVEHFFYQAFDGPCRAPSQLCGQNCRIGASMCR